MSTKVNLKDTTEEDMPKTFYKYYSLDTKPQCSNCNKCEACCNKKIDRLKSQFQGKVYFSSPLDFNDLLDSRLTVSNNAEQLSDEQLLLKMRELFYSREEEGIEQKEEDIKRKEEDIKRKEEVIKQKAIELKSIECSNELVKEVQEAQLKNLGILCLAESNVNPNMWGYYANNTGFCIEYDSKNFVYDMVIDFVSQMPKQLTELLVEKNYCTEDRDFDKMPKRTAFAWQLFNDEENIKNCLTKNTVLRECSAEECKYFVQNIYVKRFWGKKVEYHENSLEQVKPTLFEDKTVGTITGKYIVKSKFWEHESEYRFLLSLGGKKEIRLGKEAIKSITFGGNTPDETIRSLKGFIADGIAINKIQVSQENKLIAQHFE